MIWKYSHFLGRFFRIFGFVGNVFPKKSEENGFFTSIITRTLLMAGSGFVQCNQQPASTRKVHEFGHEHFVYGAVVPGLPAYSIKKGPLNV